MIIRDWDVWHVYSSFLNTEKVDLNAAGSALVSSGVATCVLHRDGQAWWHTDERMRSGMTTFVPNCRRVEVRFSLEIDGGGSGDLVGYTAEMFHQAAHFRCNELRVRSDLSVPPPYVRAMLGEFHLFSPDTGFGVVLYPVIKLFESGVILVQFRAISPKRDMPLDEFIDNHVNLGQMSFGEVEVPPAISSLATRAYYHSYHSRPLLGRAELNLSERYHSRGVKEKTREVASGDFMAKLAPLSSDNVTGDTLSSLAQMLYSIVGFVISNPRTGITFLLRGQRRIILPGDFWCGRPHVHLIDFEGQKRSARENVQTYGAQFGWIHGRLAGGSSEIGLRYLPEDMRHFEDYSALLSQSASLWIWSKEGRERQEPSADANRGHLIYEHQSIVELLEYVYMLHRALLAKTGTSKSMNDVHALRWAINNLRSHMSDVSSFGEIRDLLSAGWTELGVDDLKSRISEALSIREAEINQGQMRSNERISRWLTIIFGMIATPILANEVLRPLWAWFELWRPSSGSAESLFFIGIALVIVVMAIVAVSSRILRSQRR